MQKHTDKETVTIARIEAQAVASKVNRETAKEPDKVIDAVLAMDRITYESKFTYDPEKVTIQLPQNQTGVSEITLAYKEIAPFIDPELVNADQLKEQQPTLDENKKYVALTFDDGPNDTSTLDLLKILKDNNVKATFFELGQMVDQYPEVSKKSMKKGMKLPVTRIHTRN